MEWFNKNKSNSCRTIFWEEIDSVKEAKHEDKKQDLGKKKEYCQRDWVELDLLYLKQKMKGE